MENIVSEGSASQKVLLTNEEREKLCKINSYAERFAQIEKNPFILPYVLTAWKSDKNIEHLVKLAVEKMPENITRLSRGGIVATKELVGIAITSDPKVVFKLTPEQKALVSLSDFIVAFKKNPIMLVSDCPVLKSRIKRTISVFDPIKEQIVDKEISPALRTELLKALRMATGVSVYHKGYDDYASEIASALSKNPDLEKYISNEELYTKNTTTANICIKKEYPFLRAAKPEFWKLNNNKVLYSAVRRSAKLGSMLNDLMADIPFCDLNEKVKAKAVENLVKVNPASYFDLPRYDLASYQSDPFIQYVAYKSCKKSHDDETWQKIADTLTTKEQKLATSKFNRQKTARKNKKDKKAVDDKKVQLPATIKGETVKDHYFETETEDVKH